MPTRLAPTPLLTGLFALLVVALPFLPGVPPFWLTLMTYAGLSAIVVTGLVVLTGLRASPPSGRRCSSASRPTPRRC